MEFNLRQDFTTIFCEVDDFCQLFERHLTKLPQLPDAGEKNWSFPAKLKYVEIAIAKRFGGLLAFSLSGYRTFKDYYTRLVLPSWRPAFPNLVSSSRFVELMPLCIMQLCCFLQVRRGENTGISCIDSTPIEVCHPCRSKSRRGD